MVELGAMAKFEYKTQPTSDLQTIEADRFDLNTKDGKLTFIDEDNNDIASYAIAHGAYVKRVGK